MRDEKLDWCKPQQTQDFLQKTILNYEETFEEKFHGNPSLTFGTHILTTKIHIDFIYFFYDINVGADIKKSTSPIYSLYFCKDGERDIIHRKIIGESYDLETVKNIAQKHYKKWF